MSLVCRASRLTGCHLLRTSLLPSTSQCCNVVGQIRGLRSKKEIYKEERQKSLSWAKPFLEHAEQQKQKAQGEVVSDNELPEPHKVHAVFRIHTLAGRPYWEKETMKELGLDINKENFAVVKNTPHNNKLLSEVKHLVKIMPLKLPHGLPQDPSDYEHCYINSKGELIVKHKLKEYEPDKDEPARRAKWKLTKDVSEKKLRRTLQLYDVHSEYYEPHHEWKKNEDGKEYRYNFNKDVRKYKY